MKAAHWLQEMGLRIGWKITRVRGDIYKVNGQRFVLRGLDIEIQKERVLH